MGRRNNKKHWYDGWFYRICVDPWIKTTRRNISALIENGCSVVDVCCGTGALVFQLAPKCRYVLGLDLSMKMILHAKKTREKQRLPNVKFCHADATQLSKVADRHFDYATVVYGLHEMVDVDRVKVLNEMKAISRKIIIADFTAPQPKNVSSMTNTIIEFLAGLDHYRNSRHFLSSGGIEGLLETCGLTIEAVVRDRAGTTTIVTAY